MAAFEVVGRVQAVGVVSLTVGVTVTFAVGLVGVGDGRATVCAVRPAVFVRIDRGQHYLVGGAIAEDVVAVGDLRAIGIGHTNRPRDGASQYCVSA